MADSLFLMLKFWHRTSIFLYLGRTLLNVTKLISWTFNKRIVWGLFILLQFESSEKRIFGRHAEDTIIWQGSVSNIKEAQWRFFDVISCFPWNVAYVSQANSIAWGYLLTVYTVIHVWDIHNIVFRLFGGFFLL